METNIRYLLGIFLAIYAFMTIAMNTLVFEYKLLKRGLTSINPIVERVSDIGSPVDLSIVSGDSVLGMVPFALSGEFDLIVDGITISKNMDLSDIRLSGVSGYNYKLIVNRGVDNMIVNVVANVIQ